MIMQNDYGLNLYNGDIGLVLPQLGEDGKIRAKVVFIGTDQQVRWLQASRLPSHETVFAMTVHKSQGSEFTHCALVLPDHNAQVLTKELIYTGITRAKKTANLYR
jgi:exodeoxyribonuclease V alpha subunit